MRKTPVVLTAITARNIALVTTADSVHIVGNPQMITLRLLELKVFPLFWTSYMSSDEYSNVNFNKRLSR